LGAYLLFREPDRASYRLYPLRIITEVVGYPICLYTGSVGMVRLLRSGLGRHPEAWGGVTPGLTTVDEHLGRYRSISFWLVWVWWVVCVAAL
jgi:hypothetical protein